jgi:hypothetical protein
MRHVQRRRLRRLVPDEALIRRRARGAPVRELAADYDVAHTTLVRYFARPEVVKQLKAAANELRAEDQAAARRRRAERQLEREVRRKAREQAALERAQEAHSRAARAKSASRRRPPRTSYEAWLDERDARRPLTRAELYSTADEIAARVVAEGGGIQAVIEATDSRTLENVVCGIDPAILVQAYDNDLLARAQAPPA